jgi:hypothetical protein
MTLASGRFGQGLTRRRGWTTVPNQLWQTDFTGFRVIG